MFRSEATKRREQREAEADRLAKIRRKAATDYAEKLRKAKLTDADRRALAALGQVLGYSADDVALDIARRDDVLRWEAEINARLADAEAAEAAFHKAGEDLEQARTDLCKAVSEAPPFIFPLPKKSFIRIHRSWPALCH